MFSITKTSWKQCIECISAVMLPKRKRQVSPKQSTVSKRTKAQLLFLIFLSSSPPSPALPLPCLFWKLSWFPGWPWLYMPKNDPASLINCSTCQHFPYPGCTLYWRYRIQSRTLCLLDKYATNWVMSITYYQSNFKGSFIGFFLRSLEGYSLECFSYTKENNIYPV